MLIVMWVEHVIKAVNIAIIFALVDEGLSDMVAWKVKLSTLSKAVIYPMPIVIWVVPSWDRELSV